MMEMIQSNGTRRRKCNTCCFMGTNLTPIHLFFFFFFLSFLLCLSSLFSFPVYLMLTSLSLSLHLRFALLTSPLGRLSTDQRLDLNKLSPNDSDTVRGQIVGEYTHKERGVGGGVSGGGGCSLHFESK